MKQTYNIPEGLKSVRVTVSTGKARFDFELPEGTQVLTIDTTGGGNSYSVGPATGASYGSGGGNGQRPE